MPILRNFALHAFDFPRTKRDTEGNPIAGNAERLVFPPGENAGNGKVKPSYTEIDDAALAELKEHDTARDWFGPDGLVVEGTPRYPVGSAGYKAEKAEEDRLAKIKAEADADAAGEPIPGTEGGKFRSESSSPTMPWGAGPPPEATIAVHGEVVPEHQRMNEHGQPAPADANLPAEPSGLNTKAE